MRMHSGLYNYYSENIYYIFFVLFCLPAVCLLGRGLFLQSTKYIVLACFFFFLLRILLVLMPHEQHQSQYHFYGSLTPVAKCRVGPVSSSERSTMGERSVLGDNYGIRSADAVKKKEEEEEEGGGERIVRFIDDH